MQQVTSDYSACVIQLTPSVKESKNRENALCLHSDTVYCKLMCTLKGIIKWGAVQSRVEGKKNLAGNVPYLNRWNTREIVSYFKVSEKIKTPESPGNIWMNASSASRLVNINIKMRPGCVEKSQLCRTFLWLENSSIIQIRLHRFK